VGGTSARAGAGVIASIARAATKAESVARAFPTAAILLGGKT
jgi:hypothetical protein